MKYGTTIKAALFAVVTCLLLSYPVTSSAWTFGAKLVEPRYLSGIDTIVLINTIGPKANEVFGFDPDIDQWIYSFLLKEFLSETRVKIRSLQGLPGSLTSVGRRKNEVFLLFNLSAREEIVNNKPVKTAALTLQFRQSHYYDPNAVNFSPWPVSYPFLLPDTKEELSAKIEEGVRYLTDGLPAYFCLEAASKTAPCVPETSAGETGEKQPPSK